jgi:glycosyltransferase involved in cell wall biosynthesis
LFLLPSLYEGLGIVLVEAQAAGLTCLVSDVIPEEADVVPQLVKRLPLQDTAEQWATEVIEKKKLAAENTIKQHEALLSVEDSIFCLKQVYGAT